MNKQLFEQAQTLEREGNHGDAMKKYTDFINAAKSAKFNRDDEKLQALAYNNRGFLKYLQVDFDGAIDDYTSSINLNNHAAITYYNRGTVHYRMSRFQEAITDMKQALSLKPDFEPAKTGLHHAEIDKVSKENRGW